jgi:glycerophosphoryl diester phosphodiesterase
VDARDLVRSALRRKWLKPLDPLVRDAALVAAKLRRRPLPSSHRLDAIPRPVLLGHRGAMARAPENTLGSFKAAIDDGAHGIELDTQLSADAIPIVLHDDTLDRTTNLVGLPIRFEAAELDDADAGTWYPGWPREKIPRLDEVFRALPKGSVINVELKGPTPKTLGLERHVLSVIAKHPEIHVIVSSFHPAQLLAVRELDPRVPIGLLFHADANVALRNALTAPLLMPDAVHPPSNMVDADFVKGAHDAGMRVHVWAVQDAQDAERLLELGVDGLIVDDVADIKKVFNPRAG